MAKKKRRKLNNVELNLAAMLDMAFQLLAFFILTFKPNPVEGQISLRLPPPKPVVATAGQVAGSDTSNTNPLQGVTSLVITVTGSPGGSIRSLGVADQNVGDLGGLERRLREIFGGPANAFDQVLVQVGSSVKYEALMQVIDVCTRQTLANGDKLTKLSFVELPGA